MMRTTHASCLLSFLVSSALLACSSPPTTQDANTDTGQETSLMDRTNLIPDTMPGDILTVSDGGIPTLNDVPAVDAPPGAACGYRDQGRVLHIADQIDFCLPPVVCNSETCPPPLGSCVNGQCQFNQGYSGLLTTPEVWATYYCDLSNQGCHGVTQVEYPEITAGNIAQALGIPVCDRATGAGRCVGIAASSPMVVGNSQEARNPQDGQLVRAWGLGYTEASGLCYEITGPGGSAVVALTDRCGGYCRCNGSGYQECGPCINAPDMQPNCSCVGNVPGLFTDCCGNGCATTQQNCDWCASNTHGHFDLDTGTFNHVCGAAGIAGSCRITSVRFFPCLAQTTAWPPGGGGASCAMGSFSCSGPAPHQVQVPGTSCCCNWDLQPQPDGTCR